MHIPVLLKETIYYLDPKENENFIDATLGQAGHSREILKRNGPLGKVLGIEQDQEVLKATAETLKDSGYEERVIIVNDNFVNLKEIVERENFLKVKGIIMDLGVSSWHFEESGRGFTFLKDEPLIMALDSGRDARYIATRYKGKSPNAKEIINSWSQEDLEKIFRDFGQERFSKRIAENIVLKRKIRPIETTFELIEIIKKSVPASYERGRINPATRIFMALRIAVNKELANLEKALPQSIDILDKGGKLVVISFHSLEDRIVKNIFKTQEKQGIVKILTKKPVEAGSEELKINQRSRSAKLRVVQKII